MFIPIEWIIVLAQGPGIPLQETSSFLFLTVQEERVVAAGHRPERHSPDQHGYRQWHNRGHLVGEGRGERRRKKPNSDLELVPARRVWVGVLVQPEAAKEEHQVCVREYNEGDSPEVATGAEDGHAGVEGEEEQPNHGEPGETLAAGAMASLFLARWMVATGELLLSGQESVGAALRVGGAARLLCRTHRWTRRRIK